ncbi:MAG: ABC transporter substrate-binding protein [Alphaproteobacteria bacterium]|nr:ABC transporter substrate-binding protein [Alphaproteobacteria bacterium]
MRRLTVILAVMLSAIPALAAEIKVLSAGAFKPVVVALVPEFEKQTGHKVAVDNDTAGGLARRITGGEAFDLVVIPPGGIDPLVKAGKVVDGSAVRLARVAIGVAVKKGAPAPDISSVAAFQEALLKARAVAYIDPAAGGSSGIYLTELFGKLGIAERIKPKAVLVPGGLVAERLVNDQADIALHQISEILAVSGATLVGPIPREIQNYTVYAGALGTAARDVAATRALLAALRGSSAEAILKDKGMEPVPAN